MATFGEGSLISAFAALKEGAISTKKFRAEDFKASSTAPKTKKTKSSACGSESPTDPSEDVINLFYDRELIEASEDVPTEKYDLHVLKWHMSSFSVTLSVALARTGADTNVDIHHLSVNRRETLTKPKNERVARRERSSISTTGEGRGMNHV
jgi:hypothetical protein